MDGIIREGGEGVLISEEDMISKKDLLERIKVLESKLETLIQQGLSGSEQSSSPKLKLNKSIKLELVCLEDENGFI